MAPFTVDDYHVGIICALDSEMAAVQAMLDEEHETTVTQDIHDHNAYSLGWIHRHNVVIACLPAGVDGLTAAATVAKDMLRTFRQVRFGLLVGIGGGVPDLDRGIDIRLGDIVVSQPTATTGGVVQYDKGKSNAGGEWERKGTLNAPPTVLLTALQRLKAQHLTRDSQVSSFIANMLQRYPKMVRTGYAFPGHGHDCLRYAVQSSTANYVGVVHEVVSRVRRETNDPEIYYGIIASGNQVVKNAAVRDHLRRECGALCIEMEAAGLMNEFPCLVIRGICDYADEYKSDRWHRYAAATAAAFAKELLLYVSAEQTYQEQPIQQILGPLTEHFEQIHTHHARQGDHLRRQERQYQNDKQRDCHQAFKTSSYEEYKNINPNRAPRTCRWLLDHAKYLQWRENQGSDLLWVSADPGCGKSVLSRSLIDHDLSSSHFDPSTTVCYFFFKDNGVQDGLATALCAVLHQLFDHQPHLIQYALPAWEKNGSKIVTEVDELWRVFQKATGDHQAQHVVCVLDALDECRDVDRRRLISILCNFYNDTAPTSSASGRLKFLVTSRPYNDIEYHFGQIAAKLPSIRIRGEDECDSIRSEIDSVVRAKVLDITKNLQLAPTTAERLEKQLLAMEHRTYLWLYLATESIRRTFSQSLRPDQESIELLPHSVDEAYEQILGRVDQKQRRQVRTILKIIIGAPRPLTMGEMALALDVATSKSIPSSFSDLSIREDQLASRIRDWCGLFVCISHSQLYLIHQTAKEFLLRDPEQSCIDSGKWKHCLSATDVELEMATIYILYLCLEEFQVQEMKTLDSTRQTESFRLMQPRDMNDGHVQQRVDHKHKLFRLAAIAWADHWRSVEVTAGQFLKEKAWLLYQRQHFPRWSREVWQTRRSSGNYSDSNRLILAAYNGHVDVVHRILTDGRQDMKDQDGQGFIFYRQGGEMGYHDIVTLLLVAEAAVSANAPQVGPCGTALRIASARGHDKVVQILLAAGAEVNASETRGQGAALQLASDNGHEKVVQMLLEAGAEVNAREPGLTGTALEAASRSGHEKLVRMLLKAGADVNAPRDKSDFTALHLASMMGHEKVVRVLIEAGAQVNEIRHGITALHAASESGHEKVVRTLLEAGAEVNAMGPHGTALSVASRHGHKKVVQILLAVGAECTEDWGDRAMSPG